MEKFVIGDLVQFKQEKTSQRKCWPAAPNTYHDEKYGWNTTYFYLLQRDARPSVPSINPTENWEPTKKVPMVITDSTTKCLTNSPLAAIREKMTREFVKVIVFTQEGNLGKSESFWVRVEDIEPFKDKTYMQELTQKLRDKLGNNP